MGLWDVWIGRRFIAVVDRKALSSQSISEHWADSPRLSTLVNVGATVYDAKTIPSLGATATFSIVTTLR